MARENGNIRGDVSADEFSLETILAEYKGTAYIDGDKRTPAHILNEKAEKIIMEVTSEETESLSGTEKETAPEGGGNWFAPESVNEGAGEPENGEKAEKEQTAEKTEKTDSDILFFENYSYAPRETTPEIAKEVEEAISGETGEKTRERVKRAFGIFGRFREYGAENEDEAEEEQEEIVYEEPELREAAQKFGSRSGLAALRFTAAFMVTVIMAIATFAAEAGLRLPFELEENIAAVAGILLIMQLMVMIIGADIIVRGAERLAGGKPNAETLVLLSCAFSLISGAFSMIKGGGIGLPYSTVSAASLSFTLLGERYYLRGLTDTLKTASFTSEPYGLVSEYRKDIEKTVLKKAYKRSAGFYNNLMHPDISEVTYGYAAPLLLVLSVVLSVFTAVSRDMGPYMLHMLAGLLSASAAFSSVIAYAIPFASVARTARRSGTAIAGWGGAEDIWNTDGACVTDDDLFPAGTLSLSGAQIFSGVSDEKAVRYTASLIIASGSGLARVFAELLARTGTSLIHVEEFACYEGGVGALIRGERVMAGSAALMNLLGIRIPDEMNLKNAVFTAVNDKLISMFAVNYVPVNSVQSGLVTILKWRVKLFFAVRDFNITPLMLEQKFKVAVDDIEYIPAQNSYSISDGNAEEAGRVAAVLAREGLGPMGEAVTGGRLLKTAATAAAILSAVSSFMGVVIMFLMYWLNSLTAARPGNLLIYMLSTLGAVLMACGYVKCRK